jgi:predicted dienelactone hydrolase
LIAAAPLHPRNNFRDDSGAGSSSVMEGRPRQVSAIIDQLISETLPEFNIASRHVGGFGFSLGGYTMLSVMGARPEMSLIWKSCQSYSRDPVCHVVRRIDPSRLTVGGNTDFSDNRLCAAVVVDPLASSFSDENLTHIQTKFVQLWKPEIENVLLAKAHIDRVSETLNNMPSRAPVEMITVANAQHYSFIAPFPKVIEGEIPKELTEDHPDFDRALFQEEFAERVSSFLADSLSNCEN